MSSGIPSPMTWTQSWRGWAVSYTHLDVYKRQTFKSDYPGIWEVGGEVCTLVSGEWIEFDNTDNNQMCIRDRRVSVGRTENLPHQRLPITISTSLPSILLRCAGMKAVSYTHLDVYKRQQQVHLRSVDDSIPFVDSPSYLMRSKAGETGNQSKRRDSKPA